MANKIEEYVSGMIWLVEYPVHFGGMDIFARMTVIRLNNGDLWIHDPCEIDASLKTEIDRLGKVTYIVAPGTYHHLYVSDFQQHYPDAETFLCPGLEHKKPGLKYDWILGQHPDNRWQDEFDQVFVQGTKIISEVAFLHRDSKTLILVDLLENIGDDYQHDTGLWLKFWWKAVFRMWNNPKAAPEYQMGWGNKQIVKQGLSKILTWDFSRIILAHGNLVETDAKAVLKKAWANVLSSE